MASNQNFGIEQGLNASLKVHWNVFDVLDYDTEYESSRSERQKWAQIEQDFNMDYPFTQTLYTIDEEEASPLEMDDDSSAIVVDETNEAPEEQVLSQRLSQLSTTNETERETSIDRKRRRTQQIDTTTTTTTTSESIAKRIRLAAEETEDKDVMPSYLTSDEKFFDRMVTKITGPLSSTDLDQVRQMAFFMHQISRLTILQDVWSAYLQAGTGTWKGQQITVNNGDGEDGGGIEGLSMPVDRRYWPNHIQSLIQLPLVVSPTDANDENKQMACEKVVHERLRYYKDKVLYYQTRFDQMKPRLARWDTALEQNTQAFVNQHGLVATRMKCTSKIAILGYQYEDEICQRQYQGQAPTQYQISIAKRLYDLECQLETAKCDLMEYRQRIICNKPLPTYDTLEVPLIDGRSNQQSFDQYTQLIERTKTDLMAIELVAKQVQIYQYRTSFDEETKNMWQNHRHPTANKQMTKPLLDLITRRSTNLIEKVRELRDFKIQYHVRADYGQMEDVERGRPRNRKSIGFLSSLIIDPKVANMSLLTEVQRRLLRRGPTYVAPGQLHISSTFQSTKDLVLQQYVPLKHQLAIMFDRYHVGISRSINFQKHAFETFQNLYSIELPNDLQQRALEEKKIIQTLRSTLKKNHLLLRRTADQNNTFYLGYANDFTDLSRQYMADHSEHYHVLIDLNETSEHDMRQQLNQKFLSFNVALDKLFQEKRFNTDIHKRLQAKIDQVKMPYLYFLPDLSMSHSLQVKPMIAAHHSATSRLAHCLKQLLRPVVTRHMNRIIFINESDFMEKLYAYADKEHRLHPTTLFATIKITNFHTLASHQSTVANLVYFLTDHLATNRLPYTSIVTMTKPQSISIDTLSKLTELYLANNIFYHDGKIYGFTKGAPNSILLSEMLSNICLFAYEKAIFADSRLETELCGRHQDQLFFTWNRSPNELQAFLDSLTEKHRHLRMETSTGRTVQFLNAHVENRHGHLYTCVHHDRTKPKYILPYEVGQAQAKHRLWFRSALMRAVRFCSNFFDFNREQIGLEMACLTNGYSIEFVETQLQHFYLRFNAEKVRFCLDQTAYDRLRRRLWDFNHLQRSLLTKEQELEDHGYLFRFSYPYDYGAYHQFNEKFHQIWSTYLKDDAQLSHKDTKVILNPKHLYSLNALLAQEKPSDERLILPKRSTIFLA